MIIVTMVSEHDSLYSISTQLDNKNFVYWSYVMNILMKCKHTWGIVTCVKGNLTYEKVVNYATLLDA